MNHSASSQEPAVSRRRLWLGALTPPGVWALHSLSAFLTVVALCRGGDQTLARVVVLMLTALGVGISVAAGLLSRTSWRRLRDGERVAFAEARGQDEYLATIGVYSSVVFTVGILWAGTQAMVMRGLCEFSR
jgi:hypothetical protein